MRTILLMAAALLAAVPADAQRRAEAPRRPRLPVEADSNDARAYFRLGREVLEHRPAEAADAFYWASQIDPGWADPVYGRYAALLMSDPRRLVRYTQGERATRRNPQVLRIDSLYFRALRMDPFLRRQFDREIIRLFLITALTGDHGADRPLASFYSHEIMRDMPPMLRGRVMAGEGRLVQALDAFDEALRHAGSRRSEPARVIRHERARMFAQAGNDSMALVELRHARDAAVEEDEGGELVWFYESKAMLDHGAGMLHERGGRRDAARAAYASALMEDLSFFPAHQRLGALALAEGDTATAVQELALAAEAARGEPSVRMAYGVVLAATRQYPQAEAELLAATELAPYYAEPWFLLALVRDWGGADNAADAYRGFLARARRDDPRRPQVEQVLAASAPAAP